MTAAGWASITFPALYWLVPSLFGILAMISASAPFFIAARNDWLTL
ncbi:hypothetical protein [Sphingomonas pituitosa]|nr:hypothetical protein [Sphingomonas pituitosa]